MNNKKIVLLVMILVGLVTGIYLLKEGKNTANDSTDSLPSDKYPIPMGATNAPDPAVLERISRQKVDTLITELKPGQTSDKVLELQTELQKLGYIVKSWKPTKFYGTVTAEAVAKYRESKK